ncbi:MAG: MBL fold metallo-hydrolase [Lachnospiraceae bacterium]|nr:MBL fold metallo-hydrolase [Lachnospiraceae bacterium]
MRIVNLIENTEGKAGCLYAHGLSFYIEKGGRKMLMDLGPSDDTLKNAKSLGIDLSAVDTVILSHGHYDHSGGILPFSKINDHADIYMQSSALDDYYADDGENAEGERYRYIGIDKNIADLSQVKKISGNCIIEDGMELFTIKNRTHALPFTNKRLLRKTGGEFVRDEFEHEHFLVLTEGGKSVLMGGCAHNGILSIMDAYEEKYGKAPDAVISGFHLMKKTPYRDDQVEEIEDIARKLSEYHTVFYTCHCTGLEAFDIMKEVMGDKLIYVHSGDEIIL